MSATENSLSQCDPAWATAPHSTGKACTPVHVPHSALCWIQATAPRAASWKTRNHPLTLCAESRARAGNISTVGSPERGHPARAQVTEHGAPQENRVCTPCRVGLVPSRRVSGLSPPTLTLEQQEGPTRAGCAAGYEAGFRGPAGGVGGVHLPQAPGKTGTLQRGARSPVCTAWRDFLCPSTNRILCASIKITSLL